MFDKLILTSEHAGNDIPAPYRHLFADGEDDLQSHRGIDIGALQLARFLSGRLEAPLHYTTISRLLVEANRSADADDLFSEFTKPLPEEEKDKIKQEYYYPYRNEVETALRKFIQEGQSVLHLSIHTFTPVMKGETRHADIGLLFDPDRKNESAYCESLKEALAVSGPQFVCKFNYPYKGTADGFTTYLRTQFPDHLYAGIEIEVNQKYPISMPQEWSTTQQALAQAVSACLGR